jgi:hypothetical protein
MEPQPPHPVTKEGKEFLASLSERDKKLHEMMSKSLGSSYFVERTHQFRKWSAKRLTPVEQPAKRLTPVEQPAAKQPAKRL